MRYFVEIHKTGKAYSGSLHQGNPNTAQPLPDLQVGPAAAITIEGQAYSLQSLIHPPRTSNTHNREPTLGEHAQLQIGQHLYTQIFGDATLDGDVELRIISGDAFIARLPWCLLAHQGIFLCTEGWSMALSTKKDVWECCVLPESPRLLIVVPQPAVQGIDNRPEDDSQAKTLPFSLHQKIVALLAKLPNLHDTPARQAFLNSAGLDPQFQQQIIVEAPPSNFFQLLVPALSKYGRLSDGRYALEAVLNAAKEYVGQEGRAQCDTRIQELRMALQGAPRFSQGTLAPLENTQAAPHIEALESRLAACDHHFLRGQHLRVASTWEDFIMMLQEFEPQIIYYYGHISGEPHAPGLYFAHCLSKLNCPPCLVYVNCCHGDTGELPELARELEELVPAVITSSMSASVDMAQKQALALWDSILLQGIPPHNAVANLYCRMGDAGLPLVDVRWMTPVVFCHYDDWRATSPRPVARLDHDPDWHVKIDRVVQFSIVAEQTRQMLRERKPRSLAFGWYGEQGQGVDMFHQRLKVEFQESLSDTCVYEVCPEWPLELHNPGWSFRDMLAEAFGVDDFEGIPFQIRSKTHGAFGTQTLIYVRHQPVASSKLINPKVLKMYLEWWNSNFARLLGKQQFALLSVSFVVKNPPKFRSLILDKERMEEVYLDHTIFRLLDEMERVAKRDLLDFLRTHNIHLPIKRRDQVLEDILRKTGGHYEQTVEELKTLIDKAWDLSAEEEQAGQEPEEEYDY